MTVLSAVQSLVQAVVAALGPSQNQRLLRLHTPLGPNVLLAERMQGTETIGPRGPSGLAGAGFKFEVLALSTNAHLQLKDLIGQPVRLDLLTQQSRAVLRPFHGHVTAFALLGSDGGLARYRLTIEPWLSFLGHRQDAWVFQDKTVMQIIDEVFADYQGQGKLAPAWRWELADASVYPRRSLCMQYHESDLAFVQRLLAEEGLFCWFEQLAGEGDSLGQHTLVIADHNGCFQPNVQPLVRYTQSAAASFSEDSLTQFQEARSVATTALAAASWDHASLQQASAQFNGDARLSPDGLVLSLRDQPGAYAYETTAQAERITQRQLEAVQAPAYQHQAQGSLRQAACATTFSLSGHASADPGTRWVTLTVQHRGRNNINADLGTSLQALLGKVPQAFATASDDAPSARAPKPSLFKGNANQSTEPLYQALLLTQDASIPVRAASCVNEHGDIVSTRPQVSGVQTAVVVGLSEPVHTDRDNRIKIQFHWQRGALSAHRLNHPAASNAPGDGSTGTWVRVSQAWAGANWGGHHTPRLGQEVLVSFIEGDIDRPVVIGSVYNGQGQQDAQGNQVAAGAATATGNAGSWFPGNQKAGELEGHQHPQVLAGFKSQSLDASQSGAGAYNQLVLDDSPTQARMTLGSTTAASWLQLGHLLQQNDNQRLAKRGHGLDLASTAYGAVRAGSGLHLSAYTRAQGTQASAQSVEAGAGISQLEQAAELTQTLSDTAQKHNAKLSAEVHPKDMPVRQGQQASVDSLSATDNRGATEAAGEEEMVAIQGGSGSISAWSRPELLISAPGGVGLATPAHSVMSAGRTTSLAAGQDINWTSQRHTALAVKAGLSLFTYGKAQNGSKPNAETGMQLHAASGNVSVQAQANTLNLTADKAIAVASVTNAITMGSPKHVLLTAGGSSLRITNGSITLTTSGPASFKAAMKELTGGEAAAAPDLSFGVATLPKHYLRFAAKDAAGNPLAGKAYALMMPDGSTKTGKTDAAGRTEQVLTDGPKRIGIFIEDADHEGFYISEQQ
jgi:type VI secretion system secreted protein VgrG